MAKGLFQIYTAIGFYFALLCGSMVCSSQNRLPRWSDIWPFAWFWAFWPLVIAETLLKARERRR